MKNYYQILNVKPTATEAEIKSSYRVLAKRYHPDVNPGDAAAADKFADINEANAVLTDPKARAEYDQKLKEASTPHANPEDVIARQRAQAQAAARAAARQQAAFANMEATMSASSRRDATILRARQAAQAQAQAQVQALCNQAFQSGIEQGIAESKKVADAEISRLNSTVQALQAENKKLKKSADEVISLKRQLAESEQDRRELETELFNRDRELSQEQIRAKDMEEQLRAFRDGEVSAEGRRAEGDSTELREKLEAAQRYINELAATNSKLTETNKELEQENKKLEGECSQAGLTNKAQIQLQQDKRRQMQEEIEDLRRQVDELNAELEDARAELEQWQQYANSEQFISDTERRIEEFNKKTQSDRRKAKNTLYGALGVLIWATDEEIEAGYNKLVKRYSDKADDTSAAKLEKVKEAYAVLSDPKKRAEYNSTINITDERIEEERKLIAENERIMEEYREQLASKEFWEHYDELNASALEGDSAAQNALGEMFYYGDEIERDLDQAVFWFKEAAKQKHPDAMYNLGICFINGEGIEKNENTGKGFIRQAAKLGSKPAKQYEAAQKAAAASDSDGNK